MEKSEGRGICGGMTGQHVYCRQKDMELNTAESAETASGDKNLGTAAFQMSVTMTIRVDESGRHYNL